MRTKPTLPRARQLFMGLEGLSAGEQVEVIKANQNWVRYRYTDKRFLGRTAVEPARDFNDRFEPWDRMAAIMQDHKAVKDPTAITGI